MDSINIKINDDDFISKINEFISRVKKPAPMMREIGEHMVSSIKRNFEDQGRPTPWAPVKESSLMGLIMKSGGFYKAKKKAGQLKPKAVKAKTLKKTLMDSGVLRNSMTYNFDSETGSLKVGTNVIYAAIQNFGGKTKPHEIRAKHAKTLVWFGVDGSKHGAKSVHHPGSTIPARPFMLIQDSDKMEIIDIVSRHLI
jgi:phage gpG-like protein